MYWKSVISFWEPAGSRVIWQPSSTISFIFNKIFCRGGNEFHGQSLPPFLLKWRRQWAIKSILPFKGTSSIVLLFAHKYKLGLTLISTHSGSLFPFPLFSPILEVLKLTMKISSQVDLPGNQRRKRYSTLREEYVTGIVWKEYNITWEPTGLQSWYFSPWEQYLLYSIIQKLIFCRGANCLHCSKSGQNDTLLTTVLENFFCPN